MDDQLDENQSNANERYQTLNNCPHCRREMEKGVLQTSGEGIQRIYIQPLENQAFGVEHVPVSVLFCRNCKYLRLILD